MDTSSVQTKTCTRCKTGYQTPVCPTCTVQEPKQDLFRDDVTQNVPTDRFVNSPVTLVDLNTNSVFPVNLPQCKVGRDMSNDIIVTGDKSMSRFHFQIFYKDDNYYVEDLGSRNGTYVNGDISANTAKEIVSDDIISAGMSRYKLIIKPGKLDLPNPIKGDEIAKQTFENLTPISMDNFLPKTKATGTLPAWSEQFEKELLDECKKHIAQLEMQEEALQKEIHYLREMQFEIESVAKPLICGQGTALISACKTIFQGLGLTIEPCASPNQFLVKQKDTQVEAVIEVLSAQVHPLRSDLGEIITVKASGNNRKALVVLSNEQTLPLNARVLPSSNFIDYAIEQGIGLITTEQLFSVYKNLLFSNANRETTVSTLLNTSGLLNLT